MKTCNGLTLAQRKSTTCETLEIEEYKKLVGSEVKLLQRKITAIKDKAMETIDKKHSELITKIKLDPRKSTIERFKFDLELKISGKCLRQNSVRKNSYKFKFRFPLKFHRLTFPSFSVRILCRNLCLPDLLHSFCLIRNNWLDTNGRR